MYPDDLRASGLADADNRAPPYDFLKPKCIRMIVNYAGRCAARNKYFSMQVSANKFEYIYMFYV